MNDQQRQLLAQLQARHNQPTPVRFGDYLSMGSTIIVAAVIIISFMITYDFMTSIFEGVNDPNPHASQPRHVNTTMEAKDILNQKAGTFRSLK